jgi:hypothetical protein
LQVLALSIVSAVVKVLLTITKRVYSTSNPSIALLKSIGSTFAKNFNCIPYFDDASLQVSSYLRAS